MAKLFLITFLKNEISADTSLKAKSKQPDSMHATKK